MRLDLFSSGEGLRDDVWAFLTIVVCPTIVAWRFNPEANDRFSGGVRNAFQRLYMRATAVDRGEGHTDRWGLLRDLTEDAFGQFVERPSIGGNLRLARALAEGWVRAKHFHKVGNMETLMRRVAVELRLRNQIQFLSILDDDELKFIIDTMFHIGEKHQNRVLILRKAIKR